ncbi:hypothetical protein FACS189440_17370 [Bacteroidia bacterium]|nr:hypothetical protein FACS189440_17370 [Bacteroidia bacterium]
MFFFSMEKPNSKGKIATQGETEVSRSLKEFIGEIYTFSDIKQNSIHFYPRIISYLLHFYPHKFVVNVHFFPKK